ncbi:hypothetical protein DE4576_05491 [Mycobacterium marinum]|nr:hypothetical protein DE4576_05491 [Mycobacterium marinum]
MHSTLVVNALNNPRLRTSPINNAPPGANNRIATASTSSRYPALGKYWITELSTTTSKWPAGNPSALSAGCTRNRTRSPHGRDATAACNISIVDAEKSVPQYSTQSGASWASNNPVPTPISKTRPGLNPTIRSTAAARHSPI